MNTTNMREAPACHSQRNPLVRIPVTSSMEQNAIVVLLALLATLALKVTEMEPLALSPEA
jgi:hypothetical protein